MSTPSTKQQIGHNHLAMSESDALASEIRSFIDAVRAGISAIKVDGIAGLRAIEVAHANQDSMIIPESMSTKSDSMVAGEASATGMPQR
jgi:hypothetical protein